MNEEQESVNQNDIIERLIKEKNRLEKQIKNTHIQIEHLEEDLKRFRLSYLYTLWKTVKNLKYIISHKS